MAGDSGHVDAGFEADESLWRKEPRIVASLHGSAHQTRINDPVHLAERHTRDGCRLVRRHQRRLVCCHRDLKNPSKVLETYIA
jgi:ribosomal protein L36